MQPSIPELPSVQPLSTIKREDFLADWYLPINAGLIDPIGSLLLSLLAQETGEDSTFKTSEIYARLSTAQGADEIYSFGKNNEHRIYKRLAHAGLIQIVSYGHGTRTRYAYRATAAGRDCLPLVGVYEVSELSSDLPVSLGKLSVWLQPTPNQHVKVPADVYAFCRK